MPLKTQPCPIVDGENTEVTADFIYQVNDSDLCSMLKMIKEKHGADVQLLPIGACSGGGGIFQKTQKRMGPIVGLKWNTVPSPNISIETTVGLLNVEPTDIYIDTAAQTISVGAAVSLEQINTALGDQLGCEYRVLGADLTSYQYAQAGATFMTGGMGPQRRYFSDSVIQICLFDGESKRVVSGSELQSCAGTYGWTGLVTALTCQYVKTPANEFAFAIPVADQPDALSALLDHLARYCFFDIHESKVVSGNDTPTVVFGLEHVTVESMTPLLNNSSDPTVLRRCNELRQKCAAADANGIIFVNGFSDSSLDEVLMEMIDDVDSEVLTIAGIDLQHTESFNRPDEMREFREAIPFAARTQQPEGQYLKKGHTDGVIRLNPNQVKLAMHQLWQANMRYVESVQKKFTDSPEVDGQILVYGHMNPYGVDPHNRITMASDNRKALDRCHHELEQYKARFYQELKQICIATDSKFIGGEKGAASESEIIPALGGATQLPEHLAKKLSQQKNQIAKASALFNWRAPSTHIPE